jgi:hypothetical protein
MDLQVELFHPHVSIISSPKLLSDELYITFFSYLFVYALFNIVCNTSGSIASNDRMIIE